MYILLKKIIFKIIFLFTKLIQKIYFEKKFQIIFIYYAETLYELDKKHILNYRDLFYGKKKSHCAL